MLLLPKLVAISYICKLAIAAQALTVRIHTGLIAKYQRWTKLWYFFRGLSTSGFGRILLDDICYWLGAAPSTIRQWLREGKAAGAFRFWAERRGIISVAVASPTAVVIGLKLWQRRKTGESIRRAWGTVSEVSIFEIDRLREHATAVTVQHLQNQSHFAAKIRIPSQDQERLRIPNPEEFFEQSGRASLNPGVRALLPFCLKITPSRIWVSKSFRPFGTRQTTVAQQRGFCDRTIRNHLSILGIERKQIIQAKAVYKDVALAIDSEATYQSWGEGADEVTLIGYPQPKDTMQHRLIEGEDFPRGGIEAPRSRFFQAWGKWWMHRCNVYMLDYPLHSMEFSRKKWWQTYVFEIMGKPVVSLNKSLKIESSVPVGILESSFLENSDITEYYKFPPRNSLKQN